MNMPFNHRTIILLTLGSSLFFGGCSTETTSSENVTTQGIYADMLVETKRSGVSRVTVQLSVGGPSGTTIDLATGERLEAEVNGITQILEEDNDLFSIDYESLFNTNSSSAQFTISFFRNTGEVLNNNRVTMPEDFIINSPQTNDIFSFSGNLPLVWTAASNTGQAVRLTHTTTCTNNAGSDSSFSQSRDIADSGSFSLVLSELNVATADNINRNINCSMDLMLFRENSGQVDSGFGEGGRINAEQSREVQGVVLQF